MPEFLYGIEVKPGQQTGALPEETIQKTTQLSTVENGRMRKTN
jgi:hypothetical protein